MSPFPTTLFTTRPGKIGLLVLLQLIMAFGIGVGYFNNEATGNAKKWLKEDIAHFDIKQPISLAFAKAFDGQPKLLRQRLQDQYDQLRQRASSHLDIMVFYYARYYMAISMAALTGIIAAVALLFVSKKGWDNANPYLVSVFVTMTCLAGFFGAFPAMFEQAANIDENKQAYLSYVALENRLLSYVASGSDTDNQAKPLARFIHEMDAELNRQHRLPVALNPGAVPDPTESLGKAAGG